jgi:membrane protein
MELIRKNKLTRLKDFLFRLLDDNLFLLSSSISYYSAVAIAPFLMILLSVASIIGGEVQSKVTAQASTISPEFGQMVALIFQNVNKGVDIGSVSGLIGIFVLFFTASLVFLQMRYGLDVIYGFHEKRGPINIWNYILERLFAMFVVFIAGIFLIISSSLPGIIRVIFPEQDYVVAAFLLNLFIYIIMFYGIHVYTPTLKPKKRDALKMSLLSSVFFIIGNTLLGIYFRFYATSSIYGAAATLLVFLIWTYYTSFTMFLSVEIMLFLKKIKKLK